MPHMSDAQPHSPHQPADATDADALRARVDAAVLPPPIVEFWRRAHVQLKPDATRTVLRPFDLSYPEGYSNEPGERVRAIVARVAALDDDGVTQALAYMKELLDARHRDVVATVERRAAEIATIAPDAARLGLDRRMLVGGMFLQEYAFEAAALFNPSIVPAPDQADAPPGACASSAPCAALARAMSRRSRSAPAAGTGTPALRSIRRPGSPLRPGSTCRMKMATPCACTSMPRRTCRKPCCFR
jgi:hypothetical protein